jgi:hypothetical protein
VSTNLNALKCPNCAAPISPGPTDVSARCTYCGNVIQIQRAAPPPPAQGPIPINTIYIYPQVHHSAGASGARVLVSLAVTAVIAIGAAVPFLGRSGFSFFSSSLPAECGMNGTLVIKGKKFDGKGPAVTAGLNCKVTIRDSTIKSDAPIRTGINSQVTIINSTIEGSSTAIELGVNAKLEITDKSEIRSTGGNAIEASENLEARIENSTIEGETGIRAQNNPKMRILSGSRVKGRRDGVAGKANFELTVNDSTIEGKDTAVRGEVNLRVEARKATIAGGAAAFAYSHQPSLDVQDSKVTPKEGSGSEPGSGSGRNKATNTPSPGPASPGRNRRKKH